MFDNKYYFLLCLSNGFIENGTVFTCGENEKGQLGIGSTTENSYSSFQKVNIENAVQLQCGYQHSLCLTSDTFY